MDFGAKLSPGAAERGDAKKVIELLNSWADFLSFKARPLMNAVTWPGLRMIV